MMTRRQAGAGLLSTGALAATSSALAQQAGAVKLPPPRTDGGKPLIQALRLRRSIREYADRPLTAQVLSDLLWAAFGVNRPATGDRNCAKLAAPHGDRSLWAMADGVWLNEPNRNMLLP